MYRNVSKSTEKIRYLSIHRIGKFRHIDYIESQMYRIKRVFALHPLSSPVFFSPTLNDSFDVSNIEIISIIFCYSASY